jgi:hypothetical protein
VKIRLSVRVASVGAAVVAVGALSIFGCSLIVQFDESKIPGEESGVTLDTALDTGTPGDTGDSATSDVEDGDTADSGVIDSSDDTGLDLGDVPDVPVDTF